MDSIENIYSRHADAVYRVCFTYFKGKRMDAQDAVQTTFVKLIKKPVRFESAQHERAWLLRVASNVCKNMLKRKHKTDVELSEQLAVFDEKDYTLCEVLKLPKNIRVSVYLHYYEGYSAAEIGKVLGKSDSTVWGYLHRGRGMLRAVLGDEIDES